jgi:D-beta-D-heptose 7-phosphate kinase/D-beta-D-heptose 1-phosphate adenosyltransferase
MKKIVLVTGGFDPVHSGHIAYLKAAKNLGDILIVGVNSDEWLVRKKGAAFMPYSERSEIVRNLVGVNYVIDFNDSDGSARHALWMVRKSYPQDKIIFANGGDRTSKNIPEMDFADDNVEFVFGVGGEDKKNSSSWILQEWKAPKTERQWGYYRVLHEPNKNVKLKELTVEPGKSLSMQKHRKRKEFWFVSEGVASVWTVDPLSTDEEHMGDYVAHQYLHVNYEQWHQLRNETSKPLKIIEIQYGDACIEEDIERK